MSIPVISVKSIGKKYKLGATLGGRNYKTLRDVLTQAAFGPIRKLSAAFRKESSTSGSHSSPNNPITQSPNNQNVLPPAPCPLPSAEASPHEFWALKDISFDVQQGEVVGIIGRNGAGKSTLLKILSEITEPTEGEIRIRGRVASLLEVGTGFHPELSGRENVYMNGAILGMPKVEIDAKFDEIVAFAGVEKFIDTPTKRYSSGMQVRLAFAVAAHLEPEILIVDEVLAVGDSEFQKKCLGTMDKVAKEGRTVLFVSHNMGAISKLCPVCLWLDKGKVSKYGKTESIVSSYLKSGSTSYKKCEAEYKIDPLKKAQLRRVRLLNKLLDLTQNFSCEEPIIVEMLFQVNQLVQGLYCWFDISKTDGTLVMMSDSFDSHPNPIEGLSEGLYKICVTIPPRSLARGDYNITLVFTGFLGGHTPVDDVGICCSFRLDDFTSKRGNERPGFFSTLLPWKVEKVK